MTIADAPQWEQDVNVWDGGKLDYSTPSKLRTAIHKFVARLDAHLTTEQRERRRPVLLMTGH
ncbi:hypothetical protein [Bradyrhizobium sp.]|uniref:hypothetical protein n=1 Tax=Bradyrhizobium sp. TaxID=376 RepID=UPI003C3E44D6